mmetsp:Transcript_71954/g.108595  ORF Transcript_71954/g.108595 Transcript_71954/m.108595 type:complete len:143 (-) Transcript_71954:34-462(-)
MERASIDIVNNFFSILNGQVFELSLRCTPVICSCFSRGSEILRSGFFTTFLLGILLDDAPLGSLGGTLFGVAGGVCASAFRAVVWGIAQEWRMAILGRFGGVLKGEIGLLEGGRCGLGGGPRTAGLGGGPVTAGLGGPSIVI